VTAADRVVWWNGIQMDENYFEQTYPGLPDTMWQNIPELGFGGLNAEAFESADSRRSMNLLSSTRGRFTRDG